MSKLHAILTAVATDYAVPVHELEGRDRNARFVIPRQVFCYLTRQLTTISIFKIGSFMGNRDHTTVIKAIQRVEQNMQADHYFREQVFALQQRLEITFTPRFYRHTAFDFKHTERFAS